MVAQLESEWCRRERWTRDTLEAAGMPGGEEDHAWMARNLVRALDALGEEADRILPAVVSGLLLEMGEDPARSPTLEGCCFPQRWLETAPALLRCGFPETAWRLVESGCLRFESPSTAPSGRWRLEAGCLRQAFDGWYEIGEQLLLPNLARRLLPLVREQRNPSMALAGLTPAEARHWIAALRREWEHQGLSPLPLLVRI
jgi:hypothetical protein